MTKALFGPFGLLASPVDQFGSTPLPNGCGAGLTLKLPQVIVLAARTLNRARGRLFDLGLFELDVLARDRIVLLHGELLGLRARILLRHVVVARAGRALELDFQ